MKKLLALLLAALMVFGMVACAKTAETPAADTPAGETTATADKPAEETTADETPAESDGDKIVIHYWAQWTENEAQAEVYKAAIARFEQAHPDCTVEVNWAGRDVREILRASIDSGNAIDIVDSGFDQIVNLLGEDYLMDLTSYMEGSDFEKAISAGMAAFAKSFASDGTSWYYIPSQPFVGTIYYNKAIFAEAGIDAMPTTWSEFMDVCQKIKDAGYDPITVDDAYYPCLYGTYLAMMKGPETMKKLKCIWTMGTCGFGPGNTTPVSEFNVYADAEAYKVMMDFGVHVYVGGYDLCTAEAAWFDADTAELLASGTRAADFSVRINEKLAQFCLAIGGQRRIDLPDAVSLSPMLWPDVVKRAVPCVSHVCVEDPATYGQVIFYDGRMLAGMGPGFEGGYYGKTAPNCTVIAQVDSALYKKRLAKLLTER